MAFVVLLGIAGLAWNAAVFEGDMGWLAAKAFPAYLAYFALGMVITLLTARPALPRPSPRLTMAVFGAGMALVIFDAWWHAVSTEPATDPLLAIVRDLPAGVGFAAILYAVVAGEGGVVRAVAFRPLAWVGVVSYGLYLWHVPLLLLMRRLEVMPAGFVPTLALLLPIALLVAAASWYLVERPLMTLAARRRHRSYRARRVDEVSAHAAP